MSHFSVLIIGNGNLEERLDPFWELDLGHEEMKYDARAEFSDKTEESREEWKNEINTFYRNPNTKELMQRWSDSIYHPPKNGEDKSNKPKANQWHVDDLEKVETTYEKAEVFKNFIEFCKNYHCYYEYQPGKFGYMSNPEAKWDWWVLGGRWQGILKIKDKKDVPEELHHHFNNVKKGEPGTMMRADKDSSKADSAPACLIDWENMNGTEAQRKKSGEFWDDYVEDGITDKEELIKKHGHAFYNKEYFKKRFQNKEYYMKTAHLFSTFSVLDKNGNWHEAGEMGWWGISGESDTEYRKFHDNYYQQFIKDLSPDEIVSIVDCHI